MTARLSRPLAAVAAIAALVVVGVGSPAAADDPVLTWTTVDGFPVIVDDVTVTWETALSRTPFGATEMIDPVPVLRPDITNNGESTVHIGLGTDFRVQGEIDHLWMPDAWGAFSEVGSGLTEMFWLALDPGESLSTSDGSAANWYSGMPSWSGHHLGVFLLDEAPTDDADPASTLIAELINPGRFVAANIDDADLDFEGISQVLGSHLEVNGGGGTADLFPGVAATAQASGLVPGETLELWAAPGMDYFYFYLLGGGLPTDAVRVGTGTVTPDGTLKAIIVLPYDMAEGGYQVVAGVRAERYWPAGSWDDFTVGPAPDPVVAEAVTPGEPSTSVEVGATTLGLTFDSVTGAGTSTVTASATGPEPSGFQLASDPPLYYHISTQAAFAGDVTVCISYDAGSLPANPPPRLFHFDTGERQWADITTSSTDGEVCGLTSSFSPFVLGYFDRFDFSGFFQPVTMGAENLAKAGQAIPVKFSLGGDRGMDVVASARFRIEGTVTDPGGELVETTTAGKSGLSYDAASGQYTYVWKTDKSWAKKTGQFVLTLADGSVHTFDVTFKK